MYLESDDIDDIHPASQPWVGKNVLLEDASRAIRIKLEESRLLIKIGESVETAFYTHLKSDEPIIVRSEGVWFGKIQDEEKRKVSKEGRKMEKNIVENKLEAYDSFQDVLGTLNAINRRARRGGGGGRGECRRRGRERGGEGGREERG